jgi:hypothetical protein
MTTLLEMVVATHPMKISPISSPGSMKDGFVAHKLTMPKIMALVMRKHWSWTKRCNFHLE